jgi:hypothetical protein
MASQGAVETPPASTPSGPRRQKLLIILILAGLAIAGGIAAWRGYPQLTAPIIGLPAAYEVLRRLVDPRPLEPTGTTVEAKRRTVLRRRLYGGALILVIYALGYLTSVIAFAIRQPSVSLAIKSQDASPATDVVLHWKNIKPGQRPGVFVYSASDRRYYPALCGVASESGVLPCRIDIGVSGDRGKTFELLPALLSPSGEVEIKKYRSDNTSAGMIEPPEGTSLFTGKTVVRKE